MARWTGLPGMPAGPEDQGGDEGEFGWIERLLRPLTLGAPGALNLLDDAALLSPTAGHDLVITKDAMVAGVHFLNDDPLDLVAEKLLAVNLSDLAAKGAAPRGYFLSVAWPGGAIWADKVLFAEGLRRAGEVWGLPLLGGDTVSTPGSLTLSATLIGEVPTGEMVLRSSARVGDKVLVSGVIGDGWLGLQAARGELADADGGLARKYRSPTPQLALAPVLRRWARGSADVSDGLLADAGRIAIASGVEILLDLERAPLSTGGSTWLSGQPDVAEGRLALASGGDDYEILCTVAEGDVDAFRAQARSAGVPMTVIGSVREGAGVAVSFEGRRLEPQRLGWTH
jgi:thiamine-monophosphate kinase